MKYAKFTGHWFRTGCDGFEEAAKKFAFNTCNMEYPVDGEVVTVADEETGEERKYRVKVVIECEPLDEDPT